MAKFISENGLIKLVELMRSGINNIVSTAYNSLISQMDARVGYTNVAYGTINPDNNSDYTNYSLPIVLTTVGIMGGTEAAQYVYADKGLSNGFAGGHERFAYKSQTGELCGVKQMQDVYRITFGTSPETEGYEDEPYLGIGIDSNGITGVNIPIDIDTLGQPISIGSFSNDTGYLSIHTGDVNLYGSSTVSLSTDYQGGMDGVAPSSILLSNGIDITSGANLNISTYNDTGYDPNEYDYGNINVSGKNINIIADSKLKLDTSDGLTINSWNAGSDFHLEGRTDIYTEEVNYECGGILCVILVIINSNYLQMMKQIMMVQIMSILTQMNLP